MIIFNSLGSNYSFRFLLKSLFGQGRARDIHKLTKTLEDKYGGEVEFFYKGREAMTYALSLIGFSEDVKVAINGFTCVAVFNSIRKAGLEPYCLDLEEAGGLNFTAESLEKAVKKDKNIKAVVVQNTLGYPCDIDAIKKICSKHKLILIEDMAHCVGTTYPNGREAGTVGDFTVLSFSQDKILDAISGGALVVRNKKYSGKSASLKRGEAGMLSKDRFYPLITFKIRCLYGIGLGKIFHFAVKQMGLMTKIMDESYYEYYNLPPYYATLTNFAFSDLEKQLEHRKMIAHIYAAELPDNMLMFNREKTQEAVGLSSNLRFPIFVKNRSNLVKKLRKSGVYVGDIWYHDVAPDCPNAASDSKIILNLPTHINTNESDARRISEIIEKWAIK
jgi:dTDP-4-amino-4,6-dideoxygalactose transaminase